MANIHHNKKHGVDSASDHNGVSGATQGNIMQFNTNGLPEDSALAVSKVNSAVKGEIVVTFDGGGSALTTGTKKVYLRMPHAGNITKATLLADLSGSLVIDIWKDTYTNFPPTDLDSVTASAPPTLTSAQKSEDSTLTGWTKTFSAGDIFEFNIDSAATITKAVLTLDYDKTGV